MSLFVLVEMVMRTEKQWLGLLECTFLNTKKTVVVNITVIAIVLFCSTLTV